MSVNLESFAQFYFYVAVVLISISVSVAIWRCCQKKSPAFADLENRDAVYGLRSRANRRERDENQAAATVATFLVVNSFRS